MTDKELFAKYLEKMESFHDDRYSLMADDLFIGKTSYLRMKFKGSSYFNPIWISEIEDCLFALDQITNNPKEVTTFEGSVTPIELAKKINSESVQHLASHSQFIKEVDRLGNVIPAKILSQFSKEELHTYENRFIATFIRRLILFIDKRYEFIKDAVTLDEKEIMYVKDIAKVDGNDVEIETKITVRKECKDAETIAAKEYIERIKKVKEYVGYYYNSPFMKQFKTEKDVRKPIVMTNILRKNPLYHKCYETFQFIERFDSLGVAFNVDREYQYLDDKSRKALNHILLSTLLYLESEDDKPYKKTKKEYKPRMLPSIDDEVFVYDELVRGPIDYVRCDEHYLNYLKGLMPTDLPEYPIKGERRYRKTDYKRKKDINDGTDAIQSLVARIRKRIETYEKKVQKYIDARRITEAKLAQKVLREMREYEQDVLSKIRAKIIAEGESDAEMQAKEALIQQRENELIEYQEKLKEKKLARQLEAEMKKIEASKEENASEGEVSDGEDNPSPEEASEDDSNLKEEAVEEAAMAPNEEQPGEENAQSNEEANVASETAPSQDVEANQDVSSTSEPQTLEESPVAEEDDSLAKIPEGNLNEGGEEGGNS